VLWYEDIPSGNPVAHFMPNLGASYESAHPSQQGLGRERIIGKGAGGGEKKFVFLKNDHLMAGFDLTTLNFACSVYINLLL
jgi:hypothetical protein